MSFILQPSTGGSVALPIDEIGFGTGTGITSASEFNYDPDSQILTVQSVDAPIGEGLNLNTLNESLTAQAINLTAGSAPGSQDGATLVLDGGQVGVGGGALTARGGSSNSGGGVQGTGGSIVLHPSLYAGVAGDIDIEAGSGLSASGDVNILGGGQTLSNFGGEINITGGNGSSGGGQITLTSGGSPNTNSSTLLLSGGDESSGGGSVTLRSGDGFDGNAGGAVLIQSGSGDGASAPANIVLQLGSGGTGKASLEILNDKDATAGQVVNFALTGPGASAVTIAGWLRCKLDGVDGWIPWLTH